MYAEDEGESGFSLKYVVIIAVALFVLVAFFALTSKTPEEKVRATPNVSVAPNASVAPSASPLPFPSFGFKHSYTSSANYVGEPVEVTHLIESSERGYRDDFEIANKGENDVVLDVIDAVPSALGNASSTTFSEKGFSSSHLLSAKPFIRSSRASLKPGANASKTTFVNARVANASGGPTVLHVVMPPLTSENQQQLAPLVGRAADANLSPAKASVISRAVSDSLSGKGSFAEKLNRTRELLDKLVNPPQEIQPRPFFSPDAFLSLLPDEIRLDASEVVDRVSYYLPLTYSTPYGVPLFRIEGELSPYASVEFVSSGFNYYASLYVDLSTAPKENNSFAFDSIEGNLVVSLASAGFAEKTIPVIISINHLTAEEYNPGNYSVEEEDNLVEAPLPSPSPVVTAATFSREPCSTGRVGAMGDSITQDGRFLERLHLLCPGMTFYNHGVVGDSTARMLARFNSDIIANDYDEAIIMGGVNNVCGSVERVERDLSEMYLRAKNAGMRVIALTITPWKGYSSWTEECQQHTEEVNNWILSMPENVDVAVDVYSALEDPSNQGALRPEYSAPDKLHPNAAGQRVIADAVYAAAYRGSATLPPVREQESSQAASEWAWPAEGIISGTWHADAGGHTGVDISNSRGTPVVAARAMTITRTVNTPDAQECVQWYVDCGKHGEFASSEACGNRPKPRECSTCGKQVQGRDDEGLIHLYCHLEEVLVRVGDRVQPCQKIGLMGTSGNARYAVHLHYGVFREHCCRRENCVNPAEFLLPHNPSALQFGQHTGELGGRHCNIIYDPPPH